MQAHDNAQWLCAGRSVDQLKHVDHPDAWFIEVSSPFIVAITRMSAVVHTADLGMQDHAALCPKDRIGEAAPQRGPT